MSDDRDYRRIKTPPLGTPTAELAARDLERRHTHGTTPLDNETVPEYIPRVFKQTRDDILHLQSDVKTIGSRVQSQEIRIGQLDERVESVDGKVNEILDESRENRAERVRREERREAAVAEKRREEKEERENERKRKHERNMRVLTILVPTLTALAAGIAAVIAAWNSSR